MGYEAETSDLKYISDQHDISLYSRKISHNKCVQNLTSFCFAVQFDIAVWLAAWHQLEMQMEVYLELIESINFPIYLPQTSVFEAWGLFHEI